MSSLKQKKVSFFCDQMAASAEHSATNIAHFLWLLHIKIKCRVKSSGKYPVYMSISKYN